LVCRNLGITQVVFDERYLGCYFNGTLILNRSANNFTGTCGDTTQATFDSTKSEVAMRRNAANEKCLENLVGESQENI